MKLKIIWADTQKSEQFEEKVNEFLAKHKIVKVDFAIEFSDSESRWFNAFILYEEAEAQ